MSWSFFQIWNSSLEEREERELKPRNRIYASELGGAMIDRWLKMQGQEYSNPPNARSRRKFEAGKIWESIIKYVLARAGILQAYQKWLSYQYPGMLEVTGKLDFIAGGKPDYDKAKHVIDNEFNWLPDFISKATKNIVKQLSEKYPEGLKDIILEVKSCSSFMFENYERNCNASPHHKLQLFHYLKSENMYEGHIVYICKDDARIIEIGVFNPSVVEDEYKSDIYKITGYYNRGEEPPKEQAIVFSPDFGKFSANYKVGYSQYLTYLYGFKNQMEFDSQYKPIVERWNRVLGRIREGKDMTDNNKKAIEEMSGAGFDIYKLVKPKESDGESETTDTN